MKVKFSKHSRYVPEWNENRNLPGDEQITVLLAPMRFEDVMVVMDAMGGDETIKEVQANPGDLEVMKKSVNLNGFIKEAGALVPKYASDLTGLEGDDGPLTVEDIALFPSFMNLAVELLMQLVKISTPSEAAEGNSEGQSD